MGRSVYPVRKEVLITPIMNEELKMLKKWYQEVHRIPTLSDSAFLRILISEGINVLKKNLRKRKGGKS